MTTAGTVGVIMPVLNNASTIAAAIESVLAQQPPPDEVLVIDGGSGDGTRKIAEEFNGTKVIAQSGSGLGQARNQGIAALDSDLVAFCDGDDRWPSDSLAVRCRYLAANQETAVVGHLFTEAIAGAAAPERLAALGKPVPGHTPGALLVERNVFEQVGLFDETLTIGTDSDWFIRLRQSEVPLAVLEQVVLVKGLRGDSLSTDVDTYRQELLSVARRYVDRERHRG